MVCGAELVQPPPDDPTNSVRVIPTLEEAMDQLNNRVDRGQAGGPQIRPSITDIEQVTRDLQQSGAELRTVVDLLQLQIQQMRQAQTLLQHGVHESEIQINSLLGSNNSLRETVENLANSMDAMQDPTILTAQSSNATDPATLANLPRTLLTAESPFLRQATVRLKNGTELECTAATFGALGTVTGTPGITDRGVWSWVGQTFVQRAQTAQEDGFRSCIVINHVTEPWPFHMMDSKGVGGNVNIPVVLVRKECGSALLASSPEDVTVTVEPRVEDCCVCAENFAVGHTQIQLRCGHRFHEECALTWLRRHNTCPYCRDQVDRSTSGEEATAANHATFYG